VRVGKSITVFAEDGGSQKLAGLIETDADIRPGDSGGPLFDASNRAIGMDTAGSIGFLFSRADAGRGYAVPIDHARAIAAQIAAGRPSARVHVGPTAFIGVDFQPGDQYSGLTPGVTVVKVVPGSPAARAGLRAGDVVTGLAGVRIATT